MLKSAIFLTAAAIGGSTATTADPVIGVMPPSEVVAQMSYLELSHGPMGFELSFADDSRTFVGFEFAKDHRIRIGF